MSNITTTRADERPVAAALLLVLAVAGMTVGGLTATQYYREQQRRTQCSSTLKPLRIAIAPPASALATTVSTQ